MRRGLVDRLASLAAALLPAAVPLIGGVALGDGFSGVVEPDYTNVRSNTTDQAGNTTRGSTNALAERYRLSLDRRLYPYLGLGVGTNYERVYSVLSPGAPLGPSDSRRASLFGRLSLGTPVLGAGLGVDRHDDWVVAPSASGNAQTYESISFFSSWRPAGLPALNLRLLRANVHDSRRASIDALSNDLLFDVSHRFAQELEARYSLRFSRPEDRIQQVSTSEVAHAATASYTDTLFAGRTSLVVTYQLSSLTSETFAGGEQGLVATQRSSIAGLSLIEAFPATPEAGALAPNRALIDGELAVSASVNLGFGPVLGGDTALRDLGLEFAELQPVNLLFLWLDRRLPPDIAAGYAFTAWRSEDNATWTQVPITGPVVFATFQNRFEVPIELTGARYLKLVVGPLRPEVTREPAYRDVSVTELQAFQLVPAERSRGRTVRTGSTFNVGATTLLFQPANLRHELSFTLARAHSVGAPDGSFTIANTLSASRTLSKIFAVSGRVGRVDSDRGRGHEGSLLYGASVTAQPLRALSHAFTYSGQYTDANARRSVQNAFNLSNRIAPYRRISLLASAGYSTLSSAPDDNTQSTHLAFSASAQPHRTLAVSGSFGHAASRRTVGEAPPVLGTSMRLDGALSFSPFPALHLSGAVARVVASGRARALPSVSVQLSPLQGGALQLQLIASQSFDSRTEAVSGVVATSLRWNIRPATYLDASYSLVSSRAPVGTTGSNIFNTRLFIGF